MRSVPLGFALGIALSSSASAQQAPSLADTVGLGAFIDGVIAAQMEQFHIPSAAVVVVKDGGVLFARGFGKADVEKGASIDPSTSMFHIGSTGKLFTWTAVMQLVEQGKLDLDTDVNRYLGTFQLRASFPQPITLRHLMTHTAGFQEGLLGYFIGSDSLHVRSIAETVSGHVPARVRPPGQLASYSNYGAALAGLIVEKVSGEPFAEYIERHLYQPLGIRYATFREPVPGPLRPYVVTGYEWERGTWVKQPPEIDGGFTPAGGTVMATLDMARFMLAHLNGGALESGRILETKSAEAMHRTAFTADSVLPGLGLGFLESRINGRRLVGHDGDSQDFHVGLWLDLEARLGLYVAYGASGGDVAREQLIQAVYDRYFPAAPGRSPSPTGRPDLDRLVGDYRMVRRNYTDIDKVIYAFLPPIAVSQTPNGELELGGGFGPIPVSGRFRWIGGLAFEEVGGSGRRIAFRVPPSGAATNLFTEPTVANERSPAVESTGLWYPLLIGSGLVLVGVLAGLVYQRREIGALEPTARGIVRLSGLVAFWFFLTAAMLGLVVLIYQQRLLERIPVALKAALVLPLIFVGLTAWLAVATVRGWGDLTRARRRFGVTLALMAAIAISWFFYQFNVLGWQFG